MIYILPEIISKEAMYYKILPDLTMQYRHLKCDDNTAVSLVQTKRIDSNALPLLICMLNLLQAKSNNPVYLELSYNPRLLAYLETVGFFRELRKFNIIEYVQDYTNNLPNYNYNTNNKILSFTPRVDYYDTNEIEKQEIRDQLAQETRGMVSSLEIIKKIKNDQLWDVVCITITELVVNAKIYSGSMSYTYAQSKIAFTENRKGYLLCVVDVGKGFYASLTKKIEEGERYTQEDRNVFYHYAQTLGIDVMKELNFLSIMEAFYYSQTRTREMDLFVLKNLLAVSNANFRIHQKNMEVVFTAENCSKCMDRNILHCVECIWGRRNEKNAPIKTYPIVMAGVHIEVEFIQEKKNV